LWYTTFVDMVFLGGALVLSLIAVAISVAALWFTRENGLSGVRSDVDELAVSVERLAKVGRRERMSAVRAAAAVDPEAPPPQLKLPGADVAPVDRKAELRKRLHMAPSA